MTLSREQKEEVVDLLLSALEYSSDTGYIFISCWVANCGCCSPAGEDWLRRLFELLFEYGLDGLEMWLGWQNDMRTPTDELTSQRNPRPASPPQNYIYFIGDGETVKIGISVDPEARLSGLQTGNPAQLELLGIIAGDKELEGELHNKFSYNKLNGEWFELTPEIENWIKENCNASRMG